MKKYTFSVQINKPIEFVFEKIQDRSIYAEWAKPWGDGMSFLGDYKQGEYIIFGDANGGTKALIVEIQSPAFIKMKHVAMVDSNGKEQELTDDAMKKWVGSLEEYYFTKNSEEETTMEVVMETDEMFEEMSQAWPIALNYFKEICETS